MQTQAKVRSTFGLGFLLFSGLGLDLAIGVIEAIGLGLHNEHKCCNLLRN